MKNTFREMIEDCPVIATVKDEQSMEKALNPTARSSLFCLAISAILHQL